jgi:hypothetical protein
MHLTLTCEMRDSWIVQHILDSLRMAIIVYYLVSASFIFHSWFWQCNPIVLWHTDIGHVIKEHRSYAAEIMNKRYTRQTPDNTWRSLQHYFIIAIYQISSSVNYWWQVTRLTGPILPACDQYVQYLLAAASPLVLKQHGWGLQSWRCRLTTSHSPTFPTDGPLLTT